MDQASDTMATAAVVLRSPPTTSHRMPDAPISQEPQHRTVPVAPM
jgi:hypothetical protein